MLYRNEFELCGYLTKDPQVVEIKSGIAVNICLATNKAYKDSETGEVKYISHYHYIALYGRHANYAAKALAKGMGVLIEGKLSTRQLKLESGDSITVPEMVLSERDHKITILTYPKTDAKKWDEESHNSSSTYGQMAEKSYASASAHQTYASAPTKGDRPF